MAFNTSARLDWLAKTQDKRNGIGALRTGRVKMVRRDCKMFVERGADVFGKLGIFSASFFLPSNAATRDKNLRVLEIKRRGRQRDGRELRDARRLRANITPIA